MIAYIDLWVYNHDPAILDREVQRLGPAVVAASGKTAGPPLFKHRWNSVVRVFGDWPLADFIWLAIDHDRLGEVQYYDVVEELETTL